MGHRGDRARKVDEALRSPAEQAGDRHAVHVPARCDRGRVEVRVGVEPQDTQLLALGSTVLNHGRDRSHGQAVVAPHGDREAPLPEFLADGVPQRGVPRDDLGQMAITVDRWQLRIVGSGQIADVDNGVAEALEGFLDPSHAQRAGPESRSDDTGADVGGRADETDSFHG